MDIARLSKGWKFVRRRDWGGGGRGQLRSNSDSPIEGNMVKGGGGVHV